MKNTFLTLSLLMMFVCVSAQQVIYIEYDNECMDRYEYRFIGSSGMFAYHLFNENGERLALNVGAESIKRDKNKPANTRSCNEIRMTTDLANRINDGDIQIYMVNKDDRGYFVTPVHEAAYMNSTGPKHTYVAKNYSINYNDEEFVGLQNLGNPLDQDAVYFVGNSASRCENKYEFKSLPKETCKYLKKIEYLPGVGLLTEKSGLNDAEAEGKVYQLKKVNGHDLESYLEAKCKGHRLKTVETVEMIYEYSGDATERATYNGLDVTTEKEADRGAAVPESYAAEELSTAFLKPDCDASNIKGIHIVKKGESVSEIASNYKISVKDLEKWNSLDFKKSAVIAQCTELYVAQPDWYVEPEQPKTVVKTVKPTKKINKAPTQYEVATTAPKKKYVPQNYDVKTFKNETVYHRVKRGETIYSIAKNYGYSAERIMYMNGLKTDFIKVGQELKVNDCNCKLDKKKQPTSYEADQNGMYDKCNDELVEKGGTMTVKDGFHHIKDGDTLYSLAKKYNTSIAQIQQLNKMGSSEYLKIDTWIKVKEVK